MNAAPLRASIIMPTFNRRDVVLQTLRSLERQSVPPERYEVIVAVDGSRDGTVEALAQLRPPYPLRWTYDENRGAAAAANAAGRLAPHDVIIVLGDDQVACLDLVAAHLEAHARRGVVLVQGDYPLAPGCSKTGASLIYERARGGLAAGLDPSGREQWDLWGGNFSVRRQTFFELAGFDESFREYGAEDTDFGLRVAALGIPFVFEPRALTRHLHAVTPRRFGRQVFSEGRAVVRLAKKHGLPVESFVGSAVRGPFDLSVRWGWCRVPRAMHAVGRLLTAGLAGIDLTRVRPAQIAAARLVRRFYRVGGIALEGRRLIAEGSVR